MPKIVDKTAKAKKISAKALKVFREKGFVQTRMVDIAEAAGIGKGTLYEYFKNKEDILASSFDEYFTAFFEGMIMALEKAQSPGQGLLGLVEFALKHAGEWEYHCVVYVDYFSSMRSGKGFFSIDNIYSQAKEVISGLVEKAREQGEIDPFYDPDVIARLFVSIYDGIILHNLFTREDMDREALSKALIRMLKKGILVNG